MSEIRADMVQVFICRASARFSRGSATFPDAEPRRRTGPYAAIDLLQMRRAREPAIGTWQPVMGAIEPGETAVAAAEREMVEETGLAPPALLGLWALEAAPPFYMHTRDMVIIAPRFCALAAPDWQPQFDAAHDAARWVGPAEVERAFVWPTQLVSVREITDELLSGSSPASKILRLR